MGLLSRLRSRPSSGQSLDPADQQPGAVSQPEGDGPVTLEDRTEPGGQGSPDTNQAKSEPMSPTTEHPEVDGAPSLTSMNVGANDAQAPSHSSAQAPAPVSRSGASGGAASEPGSGVAKAQGDAHHAPGLQGVAPAGESVGIDLDAGAAAMRTTPSDGGPSAPHGEDSSGTGDAGPSPAAGDGPLAGSSEELPVVQGVRRPPADEG